MEHRYRSSRTPENRCGLVVICLIMIGLMGGSLHAVLAATDEIRDPFVFGPRVTVQTPHATGPTLNGVLWDVAKPLALVGDAMVGPGDTVDGWQVVDIQKTGLVIRRGERQEFIALGGALPPD